MTHISHPYLLHITKPPFCLISLFSLIIYLFSEDLGVTRTILKGSGTNRDFFRPFSLPFSIVSSSTRNNAEKLGKHFLKNCSDTFLASQKRSTLPELPGYQKLRERITMDYAVFLLSEQDACQRLQGLVRRKSLLSSKEEISEQFGITKRHFHLLSGLQLFLSKWGTSTREKRKKYVTPSPIDAKTKYGSCADFLKQ